MADPFEGIDMSDPCAVYPVLELAYNQMMAGAMTVKVDFKTEVASGAREFLKSDLVQLKEQIAALRVACQEKQTGRPTHFAVRAGMVG